ncbi:MAG: FAD-dependent oxidoreductase [Bacteroidia bacterium]|nr:FAD-dependent oxidoreductase [Bacteroidia bacterium]
MKLIIAGGGSSGLGVALAAAQRSWNVLLIEAQDIGGGTSTASTKLIHGGLRYLETAIRRLRYTDWTLVKEALRERHWMLNSHADLCRSISLVLPVGSRVDKLYYGVGLYLYHWLSYPYQLRAPQYLSQRELSGSFPLIRENFIGGWRFWDGQFQDRLYAVHLALFLRERYGVEIQTHSKVIDIIPRGKEVVVRMRQCMKKWGTFS